jgi:hypothetical protein
VCLILRAVPPNPDEIDDLSIGIVARQSVSDRALDGLNLHLAFKALQASSGRLTVRGPTGTRELPYDALLLGTGRKAKIDGLSLEAAGVRFGKDRLEVDEYLRTSNSNVYAAGDVAFPEKFTRVAMASARLCVANALNGANRKARELVIPHCTYTDHEVAQVGLTPRCAREEGVPIDIYRLELAKVERAFTDGEEEGFAAIYTQRGSAGRPPYWSRIACRPPRKVESPGRSRHGHAAQWLGWSSRTRAAADISSAFHLNENNTRCEAPTRSRTSEVTRSLMRGPQVCAPIDRP